MIKTLLLTSLILFSASAICQSEGLFPFAGHEQYLMGIEQLTNNNWTDADQNFSKAHSNYIKWAQDYNVDLYQEVFFENVLDSWVGIKMVTSPPAAVLILEELEIFGRKYSKDLLDYRIISSIDQEFENENLKKYEDRSEAWKRDVFTSRILYATLNNVGDEELHLSILNSMSAFDDEKAKVLKLALNLITSVRREDEEATQKHMIQIVDSLKVQFLNPAGGSVRKPVLETLIYTRIFEVYGLEVLSERLKNEVSNVHINTVR